MNYIFEEDCNASLFKEDTCEYSSKNNEALSILDNAVREFKDRTLPKYASSKVFEYDSINSKKSTSEIGTIGNELNIFPKLQSQDSLNQSNRATSMTYNKVFTKDVSEEADYQTEKDKDTIVKYEFSSLPSTQIYESQEDEEQPIIQNFSIQLKIIDNTNHSKFKKRPKNRISGYSKWSKIDDCKLFSELRKVCKLHDVDIEQYCSDSNPISNVHKSIITEIAYRVNWKKDVTALVQRIKSLVKDQSMTVRQK